MTEKELKSLSKIEILELLHSQELEIERLKTEKEEAAKQKDEHRLSIEEAGSIAEASVMISGVMQAAQSAADLYLENVKALEADKKAEAARIENEAQERIFAMYSDAERKHNELMEHTRNSLAETQKIFDWHLGKLVAVRAELQEMINRAGLSGLTENDKTDAENE